MSNKNLTNSRKVKNDEFYTKYEDVENELKHYHHYLKDKVIYCPCDSNSSAFIKYLKNNKDEIGYKKLMNTCYQDGCDFRDQTKLRDEADIIITNPPFSQFKDFYEWINGKDFLVLETINSVIYKNVFPDYKNNKIWVGMNGCNRDQWFDTPDGKCIKFRNIIWLTNLDNERRHRIFKMEDRDLSTYKKYDNYDAIEVPKVKLIPNNYYGLMGVPISFINDYNPDQFEIIEKNNNGKPLTIDGKNIYTRVIIKRK